MKNIPSAALALILALPLGAAQTASLSATVRVFVSAPVKSLSDLEQALDRGLGFLEEARGADATDFRTRRKAYADGEMAFRRALGILEEMKAAGQAPADLDARTALVRSFLRECRQSRPMRING